jgi:Uma2 family endonuclease
MWYGSSVMRELAKGSWEERYVREPQPLTFPVEESEPLPETQRHYELRTALFQILKTAFGDRATVGSDQFVYWDPTDPSACCAPDVMLRVGQPHALFDTWKIWERGAPHLAVEFVSERDRDPGAWNQKLESYRRTGISELVRFDVENPTSRLRIWDLIGGDLVERRSSAPDFMACRALGVFFCIRDVPGLGVALGLARDSAGQDPFLTPDEARVQAEAAKTTAEARVRELEAELARRSR